uniref:G-protein coupled receptors family 1 profile domain-containing protein n=1 Tax=Plectus sambesii TaxID=2011161 RepID=A0A914VR53_9BILA
MITAVLRCSASDVVNSAFRFEARSNARLIGARRFLSTSPTVFAIMRDNPLALVVPAGLSDMTSSADGNMTDDDAQLARKMTQRCFEMVGMNLSVTSCFELLTKLLHNNTIQACPAPHDQIAEHVGDFLSECGLVERRVLQLAVPFMLLMCIIGNVLNLLIYSLPYFAGSSAVHFLQGKALANLLFVTSRLMEIIHAWTPLDNPDPNLEFAYWWSKPYIITVANICGTLSTWFTLIVTVETLLCVVQPFSFRQYCTTTVTYSLLVSATLLSVLVHFTFPVTHRMERTLLPGQHHDLRIGNTTLLCSRTVISHSMRLRMGAFFLTYEKFYFWTQAALSILLPTLAMLLCTVLIITNFRFKQLGESFSARRRCVIRITVATTLAHLLLEGPALLTFAAAALKGSKTERHDVAMCLLNTGNNFLSIVNATIPFFLYLACNDQFRRMTCVYLRMRFCGIDDNADDTLNPERSQSTIKKHWLSRVPHSSLSLRGTVTAHLDNSGRSVCSVERERQAVLVQCDDGQLQLRPFPASTSSSRCSFDAAEERRPAPPPPTTTTANTPDAAADQRPTAMLISAPPLDDVSLTEDDESDRLIQLKTTNNHRVRFNNLPNHSDNGQVPLLLDLPSYASAADQSDEKVLFDDLVVKVSTI